MKELTVIRRIQNEDIPIITTRQPWCSRGLIRPLPQHRITTPVHRKLNDPSNPDDPASAVIFQTINMWGDLFYHSHHLGSTSLHQTIRPTSPVWCLPALWWCFSDEHSREYPISSTANSSMRKLTHYYGRGGEPEDEFGMGWPLARNVLISPYSYVNLLQWII